MKRQSTEPELMGALEAARTLGVQQSNLRVLSNLPEPYQRVTATTLWRADEIRALAQTRIQAQAKRITTPTTPTEDAAAA